MTDSRPLISADDWRPVPDVATLQRRAALLAATRTFFAARGVLEVDTPVLGAAGTTDVHLQSLHADVAAGGAPRRLYLQTSPEGHMKRLVAAGSGPVYQLARVFRDGERGRLHNPEFLMLEWYRPGLDYVALMDEVAALLDHLLGAAACARRRYRDVVREHAGLDPFDADAEVLRACCTRAGLDAATAAGLDREACLDLIVSALVQPRLHGRVLVHDFPAAQCAQARVRPGDPPVAERFELFVDGVEIANGYTELDDAAELEARFTRDRDERRCRGLPDVAPDGRLVAALAHGLGPCAGVALGFDRLVMVAAGRDDIAAVLPFPLERA